MARGGIRSQILEYLGQHPTPARGQLSYWTGYALTKALFPHEPHRHESSVWNIVTDFSKCDILEPRKREKVEVRGATHIVDAHGHTIEGRASALREEIPVRLTKVGERIVELMRYARDVGIFKAEPQREHLTHANSLLLAKFRQRGFTAQEVQTAIDAGLIFEQTIRIYGAGEGLATVPTIATLFGPKQVGVEYRYKYKLR